jgi:hypothetical protein
LKFEFRLHQEESRHSDDNSGRIGRAPSWYAQQLSFGQGQARNEEETMAKSRDDHTASSASSDPRHVLASRRNLLLGGTAIVAASAVGSVLSPPKATAQPQQSASTGKQPNILVIFGDDIGLANVSAYSLGLMG